jgi:transposase
MKSRYRPYPSDQLFLFPPSPHEWLPSSHLCYFIMDTVGELELSKIRVNYRGEGCTGTTPYDPRMLVSVLLYSYATGVFSSRAIARKLYEDVAYRVIGCGNYPSYRTIARFRLENMEAFSDLFSQVVRIAREAGLVCLGLVAVDGSKVKANASKHKAMSYGRMKEEEERISKEIEDLLRKAQETDEAEKDEEEPSIPEELARREGRVAAIRAAKKRLESRVDVDQRTEKSQENFTDPESRIMKTIQGFDQCYNAQIAVDEEAQIVVAADVVQDANDKRLLAPMVEAIEAECGNKPKSVTSDSGYVSEEALKNLEDSGIKGYVAPGREGRATFVKNRAERPATARMARRLKGKRGKKQYSKRKCIVEPVFGWIKGILKFRQFSFRGRELVRAEWRLVCAALNLKRMSARMTWKMA